MNVSVVRSPVIRQQSAQRGMNQSGWQNRSAPCVVSKKQTGKKKANDKDEDINNNEQFPDSSQVTSSTSQESVASHPTIVNQKLCPCVSYWIALTTPSGAPCSPLVIHSTLLECSVDVIANRVTTIYSQPHTLIDISNTKLEGRKSSRRQKNYKLKREDPQNNFQWLDLTKRMTR